MGPDNTNYNNNDNNNDNNNYNNNYNNNLRNNLPEDTINLGDNEELINRLNLLTTYPCGIPVVQGIVVQSNFQIDYVVGRRIN